MKLENMNNAYANNKCTNNIYINNRYTIEVTRKRIKNMYLRVKDTDGTLSVSAPYGMSDAEIRKFVESKSDWIERIMQEMLVARQLKEQEPVLAPFMERELRRELKMQLQRLIDKWEPVMGVKSAGFTIKKMKTRWGSCNVKSHHLNFNLLLAKVPSECAEYVVVHELTHLLEPSHNARFWSLMEYYLPESKNLKDRTQEYGEQVYTMTLHLTEKHPEGGTGLPEENELSFTRPFPNLKALFRNTHVLVDVTFWEEGVKVDVIPYSEVVLEPDFGL